MSVSSDPMDLEPSISGINVFPIPAPGGILAPFAFALPDALLKSSMFSYDVIAARVPGGGCDGRYCLLEWLQTTSYSQDGNFLCWEVCAPLIIVSSTAIWRLVNANHCFTSGPLLGHDYPISRAFGRRITDLTLLPSLDYGFQFGRRFSLDPFKYGLVLHRD